MKATAKLRFILRDEKQILQQWWTKSIAVGSLGNMVDYPDVGEWRDVPLEEEK
jgi:lipoprotein signal peptidase